MVEEFVRLKERGFLDGMMRREGVSAFDYGECVPCLVEVEAAVGYYSRRFWGTVFERG